MRSYRNNEIERLNPNIIFRQFEPGLEQAIMALISRIQRDEFGIEITLEEQPDLADIPGYYQQGNGNFWVALDKGQVIGTVGLLDIEMGCAALRKMFVHRHYRGPALGIARQLLESVIDWAQSHSLKEILLGTTDKFHAAHRFYEKQGFKRVLRDELPDRFPVMKVDSIFFKLNLQNNA